MLLNNFEHHLKFVLNKVEKAIGLPRKFQQSLPKQSLIKIYKLSIRPHSGYVDIIYDRAFNESFHKNLDSFQHNAIVAITAAIKATS